MDACALCKSKDKDNIRYGEFLQIKKYKMSVHTFCLYLSSNLQQNGESNSPNGLFGFKPADIQNEAKRVSKLNCCYCSKKYANIGCCEKKCRRTFHLVCGIMNRAENQFIATFRSFCDQHARKVFWQPTKDEKCCICYDDLVGTGKTFCRVNMLRAPCCKNGWFHKYCLQKFANSAGYFFKCPLCSDKTVVRNVLPYKGIFIPDRDAAWELEPDAFAELLERPNECIAPVCKCKGGRTANTVQNPLVLCNTCGSSAKHKLCQPNIFKNRTYMCDDCNLKSRSLSGGDTDEEVDVCNNEPTRNKAVDADNEILIDLCIQRTQQAHDTDDKCSTSGRFEVKRRMKSKNKISDESENEESRSNVNKFKDESSNSEDFVVKRKLQSKYRVTDECQNEESVIIVDEFSKVVETLDESSNSDGIVVKRRLKSKFKISDEDDFENNDHEISKADVNDETFSIELFRDQKEISKDKINSENEGEKFDYNESGISNVEVLHLDESDSGNELEVLSPINYLENQDVMQITISESSNDESEDVVETIFDILSARSKVSTEVSNRHDSINIDAQTKFGTNDAVETENAMGSSNTLNFSIGNGYRRKAICYSPDEVAELFQLLSSDDEDFSDTTSQTKYKQRKLQIADCHNIENPDYMNNSFVGNRTRRKSVCSDRAVNISAKASKTEGELLQVLSDDENFSKSTPKKKHKQNRLQVGECHKIENPDNMNISCIANRTRRKSICIDRVVNISAKTLKTGCEYFSESCYNASANEYPSIRGISPILPPNANYLSDTNSNLSKSDKEIAAEISCVAKRTRKRTSIHAVEVDKPGKSVNDNQGVFKTLVAKRIGNSSPMHSITTIASSASIESKPTSWSVMQTPSTSNSGTSYKSCLSAEVKEDYLPTPSTSNSANNDYSHTRRKVFVKRRTLRRLSSTDDENYVADKKICRENAFKRNFNVENSKCPMRANKMNAYITPRFSRVDGKLKRSKISNPTCLSSKNAVRYQNTNFQNSYNLLVGRKEN